MSNESQITEGMVRKALTTKPQSAREIAVKLGYKKPCNATRVRSVLQSMKGIRSKMVKVEGKTGRPFRGFYR